MVINNKVLLIENSAIDFIKARLPFAKFLINLGYEVSALVPLDNNIKAIEDEGIHVITYFFDRKNKGISQMFKLVFFYRKVINQYNFDIVHSFRFQPNIISTLANIFNNKKVIIHITGLGIAFSNYSFKFLFLRLMSQFIFLLQFIFINKVIVQNPDDIEDIWACVFFRNKIELISGSGINLELFNPKIYSKSLIRKSLGYEVDKHIYICVTRLIWEKGIRELVDAFSLIHKDQPDMLLLIVGWPDFENPRHITEEFISSVNEGSGISFLGKRNDISELLAASDFFIYPSYYREGIPRSLLEALAMGLPIITTDMPGCKMTVNNGHNGILIKPRSVSEIIRGIKEISHGNILKFGFESRDLAEKKFQDTLIYTQIAKLYQ